MEKGVEKCHLVVLEEEKFKFRGRLGQKTDGDGGVGGGGDGGTRLGRVCEEQSLQNI